MTTATAKSSSSSTDGKIQTLFLLKLRSNRIAASTRPVSLAPATTFSSVTSRNGLLSSYHLVNSDISSLLPPLVSWITKRLGGNTLLERFLGSSIKRLFV